MEYDINQGDFLNKLDQAGPVVNTAPVQHVDLSPEQIELNTLKKELQELSDDVDRCHICNGDSRGVCGDDHIGKYRALSDKIANMENSLGSLE